MSIQNCQKLCGSHWFKKKKKHSSLLLSKHEISPQSMRKQLKNMSQENKSNRVIYRVVSPAILERPHGIPGKCDVSICPGYPIAPCGRASSQQIRRFRFQNTNMVSAGCLALWVQKFGRRICEKFFFFARVYVQASKRSSQCGCSWQWIA